MLYRIPTHTWAKEEIAAKIVGTLLEDQQTIAVQCSGALTVPPGVIYTLPLDCVILSQGPNLREMGTDDGTRRHMAPVSACADMWDWGAHPPPTSQIEKVDIWQVAFKSLPLGNGASLTGPSLARF